MEVATLSFANLHVHGELFANILRARHQSFIVQNRWDLPEAMGMEFDQYDTPASRWIAVHDDGEVLAGIRLTATTARCGIYSYMIRDAQRGLLDSIPSDLLYEPAPVAPNIWESSRVFVSHLTPQAKRLDVHSRLIRAMTDAAADVGASRVLCLIPATWPRFARRLQLQAEPAGPVMEIDGLRNQCVWIDLADRFH